MILPTKYLPEDRCLLTIGSRVLNLLVEPKSISRIWYELKQESDPNKSVHYEWFVLSLDFLYSIGAIILDRELIRRAENDL